MKFSLLLSFESISDSQYNRLRGASPFPPLYVNVSSVFFFFNLYVSFFYFLWTFFFMQYEHESKFIQTIFSILSFFFFSTKQKSFPPLHIFILPTKHTRENKILFLSPHFSHPPNETEPNIIIIRKCSYQKLQ